MNYKGPMLVVKDMEKSKVFYTKNLKVEVISDLGVNVTLTGGLSFQTEESWSHFTGCNQDYFRYQRNDVEFYFEEENFDDFIKAIEQEKVETLGEVITMPWGQKIIRFYDPDKHIIEVGEDFGVMVCRLYKEGMSIDEINQAAFSCDPVMLKT